LRADGIEDCRNCGFIYCKKRVGSESMNWKGCGLGTIKIKGKVTYQLELNEKQFLVIMDALSGIQNDETAEVYQRLGFLLQPIKKEVD
jgi:hypothetical protein